MINSIGKIYSKLCGQEHLPVVICSVVQKLCNVITEKFELALDITPNIIGRDIPLPMDVDLEDLKSVGKDRVVSAAMAYDRIGQAVAVASFGTAITIDCVNDDGVFLGGAILPGLTTSAKSLSEHTSALPLVEIVPPAGPWGKNTLQAISSGIVFGAAGGLREITERFANELGHWPELIITGGDAKIIASHCNFVKAVVEDLLLMGIGLTYEKWKSQ